MPESPLRRILAYQTSPWRRRGHGGRVRRTKQRAEGLLRDSLYCLLVDKRKLGVDTCNTTWYLVRM